ncbi:MAG: hypothetical protein WKF59_06410 [Chitinophagaceae bacterium]
MIIKRIQHEVKVDALPVGEYALLASVAEDFNLNKNPLVSSLFSCLQH